MENLIYKNEPKLYLISAIISYAVWITITIGSVGTILIYILFGFLAYLFVQSAFISYLKGNGILVTTTQYPDLCKRFQQCCETLNMEEQPELYLMNSDGILNALATKFLRKHYVVLYSEVVDALRKHPNSLNFYIGHELGHIKRKHIKTSFLLWPSSFLPLLGTAYARSREYTCDLHGLACCEELKDAAYGLAVLAAGNEQWSKINLKEYANQSDNTGNFWMAYHELTADYPWLCKRVAHVINAGKDTPNEFPSRNIGAWILAAITPRTGANGGAVSMLVTVAMIGILAAVGLPAYQDYTARAQATKFIAVGEQIITAATPYIENNNELPFSLVELNLSADIENEAVKSVEITDQGFVLYLQGHKSLEDKTVIYTPYFNDANQLKWDCTSGSLEEKYRPNACKATL